MKASTLIFDGRHLLWRASDAFKLLSAEIGDEEIGTGGMYGFLGMALRVHSRYGGKTIVAWEGSNNFRFDLFPKYKDRGKATPEHEELISDMAIQEKRLKAMLRAMDVEQYEGIGCEADDVIGTLAQREAAPVLIYSGDSDLRQLIDDKRQIFTVSPTKKGDQIFDEAATEARHGVPPKYISDLKALAGDSSDKIPGMPGIGDKTAAKLIDAIGGISEVIKAAKKSEGWPSTERHRKTIVEGTKDLELYHKLTAIQLDAGLKPIQAKKSQAMLLRHFRAYRFRTLAAAAELHGLMSMGRA